MSERKKTYIFGGVAVVLLVLALVTAPRTRTPESFFDQGELFFPDFKDPNEAISLEVIDFDGNTGEVIPFKVLFQEKRWSIPSHHDYPADGKDRLAKTAAGVIDVRKDDFRTDNPADYEACAVIDPLDETSTSLTGRGKRVTLKGENEKILADFIIGKELEEREGFRFVRVPGQKRVYVAKMDIDISTKFSDWIEADLLKVERNKIKQITLKDYSIDEWTGRVRQRDTMTLTRDAENNWKADRMRSDEEIDQTKMSTLLGELDQLTIVGVRPKPEGLSQSLRRIEGGGVSLRQTDLLSLQSKGYYFSSDGQLLSNEGEVQVRAEDGIIYTLRFGEIVYGVGSDVTAGSELDTDKESGPGENRYLFITTEFDRSGFKRPQKPSNTDFQTKEEDDWTEADRKNKELQEAYEEWEQKIERGKNLSQELNERFAGWYYVISSGSFDKINLKRSDLLKKKDDDK